MTNKQPRNTTRAKTQQMTRKALLEAGSSLIAKNGFAGASVRDIASTAGYTQGAFYSNFESKDALVFEIMRNLFQQTYDSISSLTNSPNTSPGELVAQTAMWLQNICSSNEKAQLEIEISLHAMRDEVFAQTYFALLDEHASKMSELVTDIAQARNLELRAPAVQIARGMIAMARGLKLMMPRSDPHMIGQTLAVFLESTLQKCPDKQGD